MTATAQPKDPDHIMVRLPRPLVEQVRALAKEDERSMSAEVRVALKDYLRRRAEQNPAVVRAARDAVPRTRNGGATHA